MEKGKNKDNKGNGAATDGVSQQGKDKGGSKQAPTQKFQGYCGTCGKFGHKSKDCWNNKSTQSGQKELRVLEEGEDKRGEIGSLEDAQNTEG
eukprot:1149510-Amphidinium_carterae.1